ncbi:MAG: hypothetical protein LUC20_04095 [Oscillospiraceae bacterium]|nr:hypothetical protein [Oscillospiraceae bacterium]
MKRILSGAIAALFIGLPLSTAHADFTAYENEDSYYVELMDNGITVETYTVIHDSLLSQNDTYAQSVTRTKNYKYNGEEIATVSLTVNFGYDGSSSWVNSTSVSKTVASGWTYSGQSISTSGGTAHLTATLKKALITTVDVDILLSCSPTGTIT